MPEPRPSDAQAAKWETLAAEAHTLAGSPSRTIRPRDRALGSTGRGVLAAFAEAGLPAGSDGARPIELGEVLGEGGMGVVRLATQHVLGRQVAVKAVRPALRAPGPTLKLLQEAWTAGRLEHPNIIPIYDIATDDDGSPLIVLRRIEGEAWSTLIAEPERTRERYRVADLLEWHLQILIHVCNAIHFAHARGVVHLDLKPDNVMVGEHGEVYVVDWGIAMALEDDGSGRIPLASACAEIIGTPHYMAPEMLDGRGERLGPRTDVFLLGAMLYHLLAGHPPHRGETLLEVLHAAVMEAPTPPEGAPAELVAICRTAMATEPHDRYASAEALRRALQSFLRHRESGRLATRATERLAELERTLAAPDPAGVPRQELFAQARFGFEQALASWPDNQPARQGLRRAVRVMVEHELAHGDPRVAAALVEQQPDLPAELRSSVAEAVERERTNRDALQKLGRDHDPTIGRRTRVFVLGLLGLFWTVMPALEYFEVLKTSADYSDYAWSPLLSIVIGLGLVIWARDSLSRTRINRIAVATALIAMLGHLALLVGASMLGLRPEHTMVIMPLIWSLVIGMAALAFETRLFVVSAGYMIGFFVAAAHQPSTYLVLAVCNLLLLTVILVTWRPARGTPG